MWEAGQNVTASPLFFEIWFISLWAQRLVREHMGRLVGKDISKAVVSDPEIKQFEAQWKEDQSRDCCTVESFRINLRGPPKSPWNISAARVFAQSYIHHYQLDSDPTTLLAISRCATTRIKSLRYKLKKLSLTAPERLEFEAAARRRGRKATVSNIILSLPSQGWNRYIAICEAPRSVPFAPPSREASTHDTETGSRWNVFRWVRLWRTRQESSSTRASAKVLCSSAIMETQQSIIMAGNLRCRLLHHSQSRIKPAWCLCTTAPAECRAGTI